MLQVQKLEDAYQTKRYLTRRERKELAADAEISHTQVKIWFQNRRAKAKLKVIKWELFRESVEKRILLTDYSIQMINHQCIIV